MWKYLRIDKFGPHDCAALCAHIRSGMRLDVEEYAGVGVCHPGSRLYITDTIKSSGAYKSVPFCAYPNSRFIVGRIYIYTNIEHRYIGTQKTHHFHPFHLVDCKLCKYYRGPHRVDV